MTIEGLLKLFILLAGGALIVEILRWYSVQSLREEMRYYYIELCQSKWANPKAIIRDPEFKKFYIRIMHPDRKFNFHNMTTRQVKK